MSPIFISLDNDFSKAKQLVFDALGLNNIMEGDSTHALGGVYYEVGVLGMYIKLEQNSYEYEDEFNYTLFVQKDYDSPVKITRDIEESMLDLIRKLIMVNLSVKIGIEKNDKLQTFHP